LNIWWHELSHMCMWLFFLLIVEYKYPPRYAYPTPGVQVQVRVLPKYAT
jgi:hypothetical protein